MKPTASEIMKLLQLQPHPTCGFVSETYRSALQLPAESLPGGYGGSRAVGGVLYFLVTPEAQIRLHRIRSDQMYHHYLGDPLEVLLLYPNGKSDVKQVGSDLAGGERPQLLIPGGTYHASRMTPESSYALLGTSVWIRPEPSDVEIGDAKQLMDFYPAARDAISTFSR